MNGHWSDCSTNNRGCPELLGPCDCGYELKVQHKWLSYLYRLFCNQVVRWQNGVRRWFNTRLRRAAHSIAARAAKGEP